MTPPELNEETLTRYVLGEMEQDEAAAVKEALIANPDARKTVEELEATIGLLNEAYGAEDIPELEDQQRDDVVTTARFGERALEQRQKTSGARGKLIAACFMLAAASIAFVAILPALTPARESARRATAENTAKQAQLVAKMADNDPSYRQEARQELNRLRSEAESLGMNEAAAERFRAAELQLNRGIPSLQDAAEPGSTPAAKPGDIPLRYAKRDDTNASAPTSLPAENEQAEEEEPSTGGVDGLLYTRVAPTATTPLETALPSLQQANEATVSEMLSDVDNDGDPSGFAAGLRAADSRLWAFEAPAQQELRPTEETADDWDAIDLGTLSGQQVLDPPPPPKFKAGPAPAPAPVSPQNNFVRGLPPRGGSGRLGGGMLGLKPPRPAIQPQMAQVSPELKEQLESLGYIGHENAGSRHAFPAEELPEASIMPGPVPEPTFRQEDLQAPRRMIAERRVPQHGEAYEPIHENAFVPVAQQPLSTFSIDVDTASYANVRRFLQSGQRPPADSVRIEELINYFDYDYRYAPRDDAADPFDARVAIADCPWAPSHKLVRVGLQGKEMHRDERPSSNLVFLLDVSGSMNDANKLPLLKQGLKMLAQQLGENDRVSIVVYAGSSGLVLEPTRGDNQQAIAGAIDRLHAGGSTNGGAGIELAYKIARDQFIEGGVNRVLLATDGDFNVGVTSQNALVELIEREAKSGVFLTVLGFGMGNLKDATMEQLSNKGNGNYAYIDSLKEAKKVLVDEIEGSLVTIAKDVKIQIEFNPGRVQAYRLIGYENRALAARDFNDDTKDAGEIGAGHSVTALYEIVPVGGMPEPGVDPLKYQDQTTPEELDEQYGTELMTLKLRYKQPEGSKSKLLVFPIEDSTQPFLRADEDFRFAASVAAFGMLLRGSQHSGTATMTDVSNWAAAALGEDRHGYRIEFVDLVRKAGQLY